MDMFDRYALAFESMAHDADCMAGEVLIHSFIATEAGIGFDLKLTIQKYWNRLLEYLDKFRRFIADKFRVVRDAISKLIRTIRGVHGDNSEDYDSFMDDVVSELESEVDTAIETITELIKLSDEIRAAGGNPDDDERIKSAINQLNERANDLLKKSEERLKNTASMDSYLYAAPEPALEAESDESNVDSEQYARVHKRTLVKLEYIRKAVDGEFTPEEAEAELKRIEEMFGADRAFLPGTVTRKPRPWTKADLDDLRLEAAAGAGSRDFLKYLAEVGYEVNKKQRVFKDFGKNTKRNVSKLLQKAETLLKSVEQCTEKFRRLANDFKQKFNGDRKSDQGVATKLQGIINRVLNFLSRIGKSVSSIPSRIMSCIKKDKGRETATESYTGPDLIIG